MISMALSNAMVGCITQPCTIFGFYQKYYCSFPDENVDISETFAYRSITGIAQAVSSASSMFTLIVIAITR